MPKNPSTKESNKLARYTDPTGEFSNRSLRLGLWYVQHKLLLKKILTGSLIAIIVVCGTYSLYHWSKYFLFDYWRDEANRANLVRNETSIANLHAQIAPRPLSISEVTSFPSAPGKYDFMAQVENPNNEWMAEITYKFVWSTGESSIEKALILPKSKRPVTSLGQEIPQPPDVSSLTVIGTAWTRINAHLIADPISYMSERVQFTADNFSFNTSQSTGALTHTLNFTLTNHSAYSYWQPEFYVLYEDNGVVVGVKPIYVDTFKAGETRSIELRILSDAISVTGITVIPTVNVFDTEVFIPVGLKTARP